MSAQLAVDWKQLDSLTLLEAGVTRREDGTVVVPYRRPDGTTVREKLFPPRGRSYWGPGLGIIPFGLEQLAESTAERDRRNVMVCEGESDALAVRGALAVWRGDPLDVIAVPGASTWRAEWATHTRGCLRLYAAADGDAAGRAMADRILGDVPGLRLVRMPEGEDARSVIHQRGVDVFCQLLAGADLAACQALAFRLAATRDEWVDHMQAMYEQGVWG